MIKKVSSPVIKEILSRVDPEVYAKVSKIMDCKWYQGGDCGKGLPGTPCELKGCVAWEKYEEEKK